jgi:ATP-dependent DNA helicase RecG
VHPAPRAVAPGSLEQRPVTALKGVGEALAARLAALGVQQVQDLLFVLPSRYEDRTSVVPIGALQAGSRAVVEGEVQLTEVTYRRRRQMLCRISDGSGFLTLRFFYFTARSSRAWRAARASAASAKCAAARSGSRWCIPSTAACSSRRRRMEDRLTPIYPTTEGVQQGRLRVLIDQALRELGTAGVHEWLPAEILAAARLALAARGARTTCTGRRSTPSSRARGRRASRPAAARVRGAADAPPGAAADPPAGADRSGLAAGRSAAARGALHRLAAVPLTDAQRRVLDEIDADLQRDRPMVRLVQGDVGCGKTVVAAAAAARAVGSGRQAALMAPTELLADQHFRNLDAWFRPLGVTVALLTGSQGARTRRSALEASPRGEVQMIVGTHALFQEGVSSATSRW